MLILGSPQNIFVLNVAVNDVLIATVGIIRGLGKFYQQNILLSSDSANSLECGRINEYIYYKLSWRCFENCEEIIKECDS